MNKNSKEIRKVPNLRNIPNLRFPEFSDEWVQTTLGKCTEALEYGMNSAAMTFDGENKYIRITDIDEASSKYIPDVPVSPEGNLEDKYLVNENDILLARTGASTGKSYLYNIEDGKLYFAGFLIKVKVNNLNNASFIFNQTKTDHYQKWVKIMSMRSGQPGINSREYASFKFWISSKPEQDRIANFLSLVDERIVTQNKIIQHLESLIKGFSQKLFSQQLRFKDDNGNDFPEWEEKRLEDILLEINEKTTISNQYPILSSTAKGLFSQSDYFNRDIASKDNTGYKILRKHQLVLSPQNLWLGNINVNCDFEVGIVSPSYKVFEFNEKLSSFNFCKYLLFTNRMFYEYAQASEQGASVVRRNLDMSSFKAIKIKLPKKQEQTKIANFLSSLDSKLEKEKKLLEHYQQQKKYLLQNLFI